MPSHYTLLSCLITHTSLSFSLPQHSSSFPSWSQSHSLPLNQYINYILLVYHIYYCTLATATTTTNYFNTPSFFNMKVSFAMLALAASLGEVSATVSLSTNSQLSQPQPANTISSGEATGRTPRSTPLLAAPTTSARIPRRAAGTGTTCPRAASTATTVLTSAAGPASKT